MIKKVNKVVSLISIGVFCFAIYHYVDYLIRYYEGKNFCFGYPTWQVYINIGLSIIAIYLSIKLFKGKIKLSKTILQLFFVGILMWFVISGIINF